ncbi:MAG: PqqD family protein [Ruminococcaceae bacterium]|nr:PqqD family protein [Oscillospiraceae bacterium]
MKKTKIPIANYLDRVPARPDRILWSDDEKGIVTLEIENKGVANRIAQFLLRKPKVSYIHLDENGSFVWKQIDGQKSIADMGPAVEERFGEASHPLYERLAKFFEILDSYGFVEWKK